MNNEKIKELEAQELNSEMELKKVTWVGNPLENCVGNVRPVTVEGVQTWTDKNNNTVATAKFEIEIEEAKVGDHPTLEEVRKILEENYIENITYNSVEEY